MPISPLCEEQDGATTASNISCVLQTAQFVLHVAATVGIVSVLLGYSGVKRRLTGRVRRLNTNFSVLAYLLAAWGLYVSIQSWDSHHGVQMDELSGASIAVTWLLVGAATYVTRDWSCRPFGWIRRALSVLALAVSLALLSVRAYMLRHGAALAVADVVLFVGAILVLGAEVIISWRLPLASPSGGSALLAGINDTDGLGVPLLGITAGSDTQVACDVPRREFPQGPESRSSILSRLTFWWITPLLSKGYRQKSLAPDDLPPLEMDDQPAFTHAAFRRRWEKVRAEMLKRRSEIEQRGGANNRTSGWQLLKTILRVNWGSFWACGGVLLISTAVGLSVPMVLNMLLSHIEDGGRSDGGPVKGYALAVGLFVLAVLQSLTEHQFWVCGVRCGMRAQSALMAETFRKALCLEPESRRRYSSGELINLMSVDACRVADVSIVPMVHWGTWCAVVMLVVSLVSLYTLLGYSAFVGIAVVLVFWPIGYLLGKQGKRAAMVIQQERDRRSRLMSEALESIRLLKSLQWEAFASSVLQSARRREVGAQIRRSVCFGGNGTLAQIAQVFGPLAAFTFRVLIEGKPLTAAVAFTSLAWFNLLKRPLNILPSALTSLLDCLVSFERLEALFLTDEVVSPCSAISSTENASPASTEALPGTAPSPPHGPGHSRSSRYLKPSSSTEEIPQSEDATWAVELNSCTLSWSRRGPPAVRDINLRIRKGELVVVVGPVGAGKSTLLHSLVGDCLEVSGRGSVSVHGRVALVGQSPWVQDTSVRENVVFGASIGFDRARFSEVVRCCGLTKDLALLASRGGEMMGSGEGGIGLSGGQRQRLGLARAVYSDPDVCLLDDVLSSLDVPVGRQIWEDCLVKFMGDKTRVVVTHQTHFLQHPAVDRIVVIDDLGCMRAVGSYRQLLTSDDRFVVDTVLGHGHGKELQHEREATSEEIVLTSEGGETKEVWTEAEERGSICKVGGLLGETQPMFGGEVAEPEEEVVAFMETEDRREGGLELRLLLTYLQRFGGPGMMFPVLTLALFVIEQGVNVLQWFWLSRLTGESGRATDEEHVQQSRIYVLMALGAALCVITASRILTLMYGAVTAGNSLHSSMLSALLKAPIRFFDRQPSGRILNRFIADQAAIDSIVPGTLADFFQQLLYFGATLVVLFYALPEMVPVVIILALPYWAISTYYRWPARDLRRLEAVSKSPVNSQFSEAVRGVSVIRAFNAQHRFLQKHLELSAHNIACYWTKWVANQWVTIWLELIGTVFMLGCAVLTVWVTTPGEAPAVLASHVDAGKMGLVMSYAVLVPTNLGWLLKVYFMAEIEFIAVERVAQYVGLESEDHVRTAAATASHTEGEEEKLVVAVHDQGASDGSGAALSLAAREVCMRYGESDKLTLKGMDLNVRAGEKAAIVGRTGAGKSSVFQLLLGFYGPELGSSCKVDGEEVVCMPTPSLRRKVRLIPQTPTLFGVTLRDVLTGDTNVHHDVAIWAALERVQMANAVRELPEGLHTPLADIEFSAGERQLLCIARALLNPAPVLLCDEVTSAIDLRTDTTIHDVILSLPSTVLLICHRLHRIREFDRVIVMDQGVTVEEGKPDDLLKNPMSHLSDMMRSADMSASGF